MSAVEMIDTEGNIPAGMDIPIYGQQMRLFDCQSVGNDIGYPFDAAAFAELCENIEFLECHRAVLAPSIDEPWRTHAIVNVAAVGIRRLDLERVSEPGWCYIVGDEPSERAVRAANREMMSVVDSLKLKALPVA